MSFFVLLGMLPTVARVAQSQNNPLNFSNNFLVTGDYVVAGAYNMDKKFTTINGVSYAVGTINIPDSNPGIQPGVQGENQVPNGAQVVAALLYWQTVEKVSAPGSGQNGYFLPIANAGFFPKGFPGYPISGTNLSGNNAVSWSSGGCGGTSTGKVLVTYRADVAGGLPVDKNGNSIANTSFQVLLPSTGNTTPITLGATLVVIYRIPSGAGGPNIPLNSILILDGDYSQSNAQLKMTQPTPGPYGPIDADANTITRLTHIVGSGQSNKFQTVYLGPDANHLTKLSSLYAKLPPFPGYYGNWDNPTWTFPSGTSPLPTGAIDASGATTQVVPASSMQGCVSWGAVIMSTTVKDSGDGILDSWKNDGGYCDYLENPLCTGSTDEDWIAIPDATIGKKDIYLHYDYMCSKVTGKNSCAMSSVQAPLSSVGAASGATATYSGTFSQAFSQISAGTLVTIGGFKNALNNGQFFVASCCGSGLVVNNPNAIAENTATENNISPIATYGDYSFDPVLAVDPLDGNNAVQKMADAFNNHPPSAGAEPFVLHVERGNAIQEKQTSCADTDTDANGNLTCIFPNELGTVGFREGLAWIKNSPIETGTGIVGACVPSSDVNCVPIFQHGKKDSYHYALFSHGVGLSSWFLSDGSLPTIIQSGSTVTFTTKSPHGLMPIPDDSVCSKANGYIGRVTVIFAITNPNLNGTFCAQPVGSPPETNEFAITVKASLPGTVLPSYTVNTDPNLSVADGNVTSMSGYSDLGGQNSVISLGEGGWAPAQNFNPPSEGNKWNVKAGTFMHEVGHTLGLTHGGAFLNNYNPAGNPSVNDYTPTYEVNCKPNVQSVMSYLFQFDLLQAAGPGNQPPVKVLDYSEDPSAPGATPQLNESAGGGPLDGLTYPYTSWFQPTGGANPPIPQYHCDGTPNLQQTSYTYTNQPVSAFSFLPQQDINFNGSTSDIMNPHNEWEGTAAEGGAGLSAGVDLQQISAAGTVSTIGPGGEAGGLKPGGNGGGLKPAGNGGGLKPAGNGGAGFTPAGGGGGYKPAGNGGASFEITHNQASSYPRPPANLFIQQEETSPRLIDLSWFAASFGTAVEYNIYRTLVGSPFPSTPTGTVPGSTTTFQDMVACNTTGYQYIVTAVTINDSGQQQESSASNTVPATGEPLLTGCYTVSNFTVPASSVQGTTGLQISWTLTDDEYISLGTPWANAITTNAVTRLPANTLVAIGPLPGNCTNTGRTPLVADGAPTQAGTVDNGTMDTFVNNGTNTFTFTWNRTDAFCAGQYTFELDLDHVSNGPAQTQPGPNPLVFSIDINDQDTPHINTLGLPDAIVGVTYNQTLTEDGGTAPFIWTVNGLPAGISQTSPSPLISGMTCVAGGPYNVSAMVRDKLNNSGSQGFTLQVDKANTTTMVSAGANQNPSVFQQSVTFTVTVASQPQSTCVPPGTVTLLDGGVPIASNLALTGGTASLTTSALSVGPHSITATYSGDPNFNGSTSGVYSQTVNPAPTQIGSISVSPSPIFVGQPITVSYTLTVTPPGAGSPIAPMGSITVTASDGSTCSQPLTAGMCTLSPAPTAAGSYTFTVTYSGDGNFLGTTSPTISYTVN